MEKMMHCAWCGGGFARSQGRGRPRRYCRASHRQRAYEARRFAQRRGLSTDEVLLSRQTWERLRDALVDLQNATQDVARGIPANEPPSAKAVAAIGRLAATVADL